MGAHSTVAKRFHGKRECELNVGNATSFSKIERQRDANRILEAAIVNAGWGLIVANKGA
jgi:hypothetical protein